jgi:hypothetical protein
MDDEGALGGGVWAFLGVEEVAQLEVDEVREALEERGLDVEGDDELVRSRLVVAIQREDADLLLLNSQRGASGAEQGGADAAFEDDFLKKWGSAGGSDDADLSISPADAASASAKAVTPGGVERGAEKVDTEGVLNAFDNALDDWFGADQGAGSKYARPMTGVLTKKVKHGCCPGCGTPFQVCPHTYTPTHTHSAAALPSGAPRRQLTHEPSTYLCCNAKRLRCNGCIGSG